ncbi:hypothetical protein GCM10010429_55520 [Micromonospora olivasterospora]
MPFAPVGGTMWAASPASSNRPYRIGSVTTLRTDVSPFSNTGPDRRSNPSTASRTANSSQIRSSGQSSIRSPAGTCRYSRVISGERMLCNANPRSEYA